MEGLFKRRERGIEGGGGGRKKLDLRFIIQFTDYIKFIYS